MLWQRFCDFFRGKRGFGSKRLILFSDVSAAFSEDKIDDIIAGLKEEEVELNVMYVLISS